MKSDEVYTPKELVVKIYDYININQFNFILMPFDGGHSEFVSNAYERELFFEHSCIHRGEDFFSYKDCQLEDTDLIISNPPFSKQNEIIQRCFDLTDKGIVKSFVLLLPISTLETVKRSEMYKDHIDKLSFIFESKRVKFKGHTNSFNKGLVWICYNISNIPIIDWI